MPRLSNDRHEAFARLYAGHGNATRAALALGYNKGSADQLTMREDVRERIVEIREASLQAEDITARRVMLELGRIAFGDARDLFDADGNLIPIHQLSDEAAASISAIEHEVHYKVGKKVLNLATGEEEAEITAVRTTKIKRASKDAALQTLAKHFKLVGDEGDGINALANALADRLKGARKRVEMVEEVPPSQLEN